ncbi:MAG: hypothetical protein J6W19_08885 [Prevotella sp.]|nr:hypothetical protein [Prevotella sp.]
MKKLLSILTLLLLGGLFSSKLWAYDLYVAGKQVTALNAKNITGDYIMGTVSYDNATKTLTLNNATIADPNNVGIRNAGIEGLTILVHGNSEISSGYNAIYCEEKTIIKSDNFSSLTVASTSTNDHVGIWQKSDKTLRIEQIWLTINAPYPIYGNKDGKLELYECNVNANSTQNLPCVCRFTSIETWGVTYTYDGSSYDATDQRLEDKTGNVLKSHIFRPRITVGKYIWNVRNDAEITKSTAGAGLSQGTITFSQSNRTLTLDNVSMYIGGYVNIRYNDDPGNGILRIKVVGKNTMQLATGNSAQGIYSMNNGVYIYGDGAESSSLTIANTKGVGIELDNVEDKNLTISNVRLFISSKERRSIYGNGTAGIYIYNSAVTANYGISGFKDCTLSACYVTNGGEFSPSLKGFSDNDVDLTAGVVQINPGYALLVCGARVTESNKNDIRGDGQFSYNPNTNTLTLDNAKVSTVGSCISNSIKNLKIKVVGTASLTSTAGHGIFSNKPFTLYSQTFADVTVKSTSSDAYAGIWMDGEGLMTIENVWLDASGTDAILGNKDAKLFLDECNVHAKSASGKSCVSRFSGITTIGVIYNYDDIKYDPNSKKMVDKAGETLTEHTFRPRMAVNKYIWDPRDDATLNANTAGAGIESGTITYNSDKGILTMDNVTINAGKQNGISYYGPVDFKDLIIKIKGENFINYNSSSFGKPIFCSGNNLTICQAPQSPNSPTPKLTLNPSNAAGIIMEGEKTLAIRDINLYISSGGDYYSLYGNSTASLEIENSEVTLEKTLNHFRSLTMIGCDIAEPEGVRFSPEKMCLVFDDNSMCTGKVVIGEVNYGMYIGETSVLASNAADILGDGHFSYDSPTKTLTVCDADLENMEGTLGSGISNRKIDGLTINLEGNNHITVRNSVIYSDKNINIKGTGALTAKSNHSALYFGSQEDINCTIDGPTLILKSQIPISDYYTHTTLVLKGDKTYIALEPKEYYNPITDLKGLTMYWPMDIVKPEGAWFSASLKGITLDGEKLYEGKVVFFGGNLADVNRDNSVDVADIASVIDAMAGNGGEILHINADVNLDGTVDVADIAAVIDVMAASARSALNEE